MPTGGTGALSTTRPQAAAQASRSARATIRWFRLIVKSCVQRVSIRQRSAGLRP